MFFIEDDTLIENEVIKASLPGDDDDFEDDEDSDGEGWDDLEGTRI